MEEVLYISMVNSSIMLRLPIYLTLFIDSNRIYVNVKVQRFPKDFFEGLSGHDAPII